MLVGVVVKNKNKQYMLLKKEIGNFIDLSLIDFSIKNDEVANLKNLLTEKTGVELGENDKIDTLFSGSDSDGDFLILRVETDFFNDVIKTNDGAQILWCTYNRIKKFYKQGKLNKDQLLIFKKAEEERLKNSTNAMKISHKEEKYQKLFDKNDFEFYVNKFTDKRLFLRLVWGRKVKPCGRECREYGRLIATEFSNHSSFENFPELMDDKEFLLEIAKISRNPATCPIYFYDYINQHLLKDKDFRYNFLKAIYLNDNVYTLEDVNTIVEYCGFEKENAKILADLTFRKQFEERFDELENVQLEYHCSGEDEKELRNYKIKANELKVLVENKKKGLTEILNTFTVGKKVKNEDDEPQTYYEFLLMEAKRNNSL